MYQVVLLHSQTPQIYSSPLLEQVMLVLQVLKVLLDLLVVQVLKEHKVIKVRQVLLLV